MLFSTLRHITHPSPNQLKPTVQTIKQESNGFRSQLPAYPQVN